MLISSHHQATEKTSQALREGQKNIRKEMFAPTASGYTAPTSNVNTPPEPEVFDKEFPNVSLLHRIFAKI